MLIKRCFDIVASVIGLLILVPLFLVVSIWIKFDSIGPIFFRQIRVGRDGKLFQILKFRTMKMEAEKCGQITLKNDVRVTQSGKFLRRFKIDELPQLINVVLGEMSLVGPRPEVPRYVHFYPPEVRKVVLSVSPGITDWASIEFKDENDLLESSDNFEKAYIETILPTKLAYCIRYVNQRSFLVDLRIIFATIGAISH
jgi:lipopolysaccharide/colanic/teichoic acid biosynthesis glycosyltransferase